MLFINEKGERKVYMTTQKVKDMMLSDQKKQSLNKINLGIKVFEKSRDKLTKIMNCDGYYRLLQAGIE